jgi:hypothetical protein
VVILFYPPLFGARPTMNNDRSLIHQQSFRETVSNLSESLQKYCGHGGRHALTPTLHRHTSPTSSQLFIYHHCIYNMLFVVNGNWGRWSRWSSWPTECPGVCGSSFKNRTRKCDSPVPLHGGANCTGPVEEVEACNHSSICDGKWDCP